MMAHRANDLSFGQLGEASYDTEEHKWSFSRNLETETIVQPLRPLAQCIPPSLSIPKNVESAKDRVKAHLVRSRWLRDKVPEALSVARMLVDLGKEVDLVGVPPSSNLLSIGRVRQNNAGSTGLPIHVLAFPSGPAGNVLRIVKPSVEHQGWKGYPSPKLRTMDASVSEDAYWLIGGGPILQVSFAADTADQSSWLAVRKAESTTILRPSYHQNPVVPVVNPGFPHNYRPSRLSAGPLLTLDCEQTGFIQHADVTFNPWYARQFAIIDQAGHWSVWDVEGRVPNCRAVPGKSGDLIEIKKSIKGFSLDSRTVEADGWARILWIGNLGTILACNRKHLAVFGIQTTEPVRLACPELFVAVSTDWILDVKRSPARLDHIIVLTSSRIFWLHVDCSGNIEDVTVKVILSQRHYKDGEDDSMKIEVVHEEDVCTVILYSGRDLHIKAFNLSPPSDTSSVSNCRSESFIMPSDPSSHPKRSVQSFSIFPVSFMTMKNHEMTGPGEMYYQNDTRFMQFFTLDRDLSVAEILCSVTMAARSADSEPIVAPDVQRTIHARSRSSKRIVDDFIVPDDFADESLFAAAPTRPRRKYGRTKKSTLVQIDARRIFELAFPCLAPNNGSEASISTTEYFESIAHELKSRVAENVQGSSVIFEAAQSCIYKPNLDDAVHALDSILSDIQQLEDPESRLTISVTIIDSLSEGLVTSSGKLHGLLENYDRLVQSWVASLPVETSLPTRLAKEKVARLTAIELCLSSVILSLKDRTTRPPDTSAVQPSEMQNMLDLASQTMYQRQVGPFLSTPHASYATTSTFSLPTPAATASQASQSQGSTSMISSIIEEDSSLSILRNYAVSVKSQAPLNKSHAKILAHWPATPGSDPANYEWTATRKALSDTEKVDSDDEEAQTTRREEERRRKRAERYLKRQRLMQQQSFAPSSQPAVLQPDSSYYALPIHSQPSHPIATTIGSRGGADTQPDPRPTVFSSQLIAPETSMSQPSVGVFGTSRLFGGVGRVKDKGSKKKRKRGF